VSLVFNWNPQRAVRAPPPAAAPRRTQIRAAAVALRDMDPAHRLLTGEASNIGEDAMADIIDPVVLDLGRFPRNPCVLKDHDHHAPIGVVTKDWKTTTGWWVTARIFDAGMSSVADQCWDEIVSGGRRALSIGFRGEGVPRVRGDGCQGTRWTNVEAIEVSSVCLPACPPCLLSSHTGTGHRCAPVTAGRMDEVVLVLDDEVPAGRTSPLSPGVWVGRSAAGARALEARLRGGQR
jgi:hypothetical protein